MTTRNSNNAKAIDMGEIMSRLDWLDEERRQAAKKIAELEQRTTFQERELQGRDLRIQDLERQVANLLAQLARMPQVDTKLQQFRDDTVRLIEQFDQKRISGLEELERLRRVEHEMQVREIAQVNKELSHISRLQDSMQLREAEEERLAHLIGVLQNRVTEMSGRIESFPRSITYLEETERQNARSVSTLQTSIHEVTRRFEDINSRLDVSAGAVKRVEVAVEGFTKIQEEVRQTLKTWTEQIQIGEYDRNQKLEGWQRTLQEQKAQIDQFKVEWVKFADQYKEARMAVQSFSPWQKQIEQQQRETAELTRVEIGRMHTRWDNFQVENDKRWKNFEVDDEQHWNAAARKDKEVQETLYQLQGYIDDIRQDKDMLWKVQSAQADAIKTFPRVWMEEVEKAMSQNPNRRRQPALVPVVEELL